MIKWFTSLLGSSGFAAAGKYILIAAVFIFLIMMSVIAFQYGMLRKRKADLDKCRTELVRAKEKNAEILAALKFKDKSMSATEESLVRCLKEKERNTEGCAEYTEEHINKYKERLARCSTGLEACEKALKDCGGGVYEDCETFIMRTIRPYLYSMP